MPPQYGYRAPSPPRKGYTPKAAAGIIAGVLGGVAFLWLCALAAYNPGFRDALRRNTLSERIAAHAEEKEKAEIARCDGLKISEEWSTWVAKLQANEAGAAASWKDSCHRIAGIVVGVTSDILDKPVVEIGSGGGFEAHTLYCWPANGFEGAALSLSKGQSISVVGVGGGEILGSLRLEECRW